MFTKLFKVRLKLKKLLLWTFFETYYNYLTIDWFIKGLSNILDYNTKTSYGHVFEFLILAMLKGYQYMQTLTNVALQMWIIYKKIGYRVNWHKIFSNETHLQLYSYSISGIFFMSFNSFTFKWYDFIVSSYFSSWEKMLISSYILEQAFSFWNNLQLLNSIYCKTFAYINVIFVIFFCSRCMTQRFV